MSKIKLGDEVRDTIIRSALTQQHTELRERIGGMKVLLHIDEERGDNIGVEEKWGTGYNEAIEDVIDLLDKESIREDIQRIQEIPQFKGTLEQLDNLTLNK